MQINYGINRKKAKGGIEHQNHKMVLPQLDWEDDSTQKQIMSQIREKHPGWSVTGYARVETCDYQAGTWQCRGDGYLWDADSDGYDLSDHTYPCPKCNPRSFLANAKEYAETTIFEENCGRFTTGKHAWEDAVERIGRLHPEQVADLLREVGAVRALEPAPQNPDGDREVVFDYRELP